MKSHQPFEWSSRERHDAPQRPASSPDAAAEGPLADALREVTPLLDPERCDAYSLEEVLWECESVTVRLARCGTRLVRLTATGETAQRLLVEGRAHREDVAAGSSGEVPSPEQPPEHWDEEIAAARNTLRLARLASSLRDAEATQAPLLHELAARERHALAAESELASAEAAVLGAERLLAAEESRAGERLSLRREIERMASLRGLIEDLLKKRKTFTAAVQKREQAEERRRAVLAELQEVRTQVEAQRAQIQPVASVDPALVDELRARAAKTRLFLDDLRGMSALRSALRLAGGHEHLARVKRETAQQAVKVLRLEAHVNSRLSYRPEFEQVSQQLAERESELALLEAEEVSKAQAILDIRERMRHHSERLGTRAYADVDEAEMDDHDAHEALARVTGGLDGAQACALLEGLESRERDLAEALARAIAEVAQAEKLRERRTGELVDAQVLVPPGVETVAQVETASTEAQSRLMALEQALVAAQEGAQLCRAVRDARRDEALLARSDADDAASRLARARRELEKRAIEAGLTSEEARAAVLLHPDEALRLETRIAELGKRKETSRLRSRRSRDGAPRAWPDLRQLEELAASVAHAAECASLEHQELTEREALVQDILSRLAPHLN